MTRQEQVLDALTRANGAWVDGSQLATEAVGGSEGLKRLREARADGWAIEERRHPDPARTVWQYRLDPSKPRPGARPAAAPVIQSVAPYRCKACKSPITVTYSGFGNLMTGRCALTKKCVAEKVQSFPRVDP